MRWARVKLGEVCIDKGIQTGPFGSQLHRSDYSETGTPVVMPVDLVDGSISTKRIARVSDDHVRRLARHKLRLGDIVYSRRGDVGRCARVTAAEEGWLCGTGCLRVSGDPKKVCPDFLYYALSNPEVVGWVQRHAVGATMPNLNTKILESIPFVLPSSLIEQERIVEILGAYDKLIENNRKQIALLEEAAQRLYKEWFVDLRFPGYEKTKFIDGLPEGWKRISMLDLGDYLNGYAFKPVDHFREGFPIIKIKELKDGVSSDTPRNNGLNVPAKYLIHSGDIIFSWSATLVAKIWMGEDALLNQHLFKVAPKQEFSSEYVVQSINNAIAEMRGLTTGSTMTHLQRNKLGIIHTIRPSDEVMQAYTKQADAIRNASMNRERAIGLLTETRDRLLPKLMSGEIEVQV